MQTKLRSVLAFSVLALSGCMLANMSPTEKLRDAVVGYNEACRWARFDIAIEHVDGPARLAFQRDHSRWGRTLSLADQEIVSVSAAGDDDDARAVSVVTNHWYTNDATYLNTTTLRQEWKKSRSTFVLVKEEIVDGDHALFEPSPGFSASGTSTAGDGGVAGSHTEAPDGSLLDGGIPDAEAPIPL